MSEYRSVRSGDVETTIRAWTDAAFAASTLASGLPVNPMGAPSLEIPAYKAWWKFSFDGSCGTVWSYTAECGCDDTHTGGCDCTDTFAGTACEPGGQTAFSECTVAHCH